MGKGADDFGDGGAGGHSGKAPCETVEVLVVSHPLREPWSVDAHEFIVPVDPDVNHLKVTAGEGE